MRSLDDSKTYLHVMARDTDLNGVIRCVRCNKRADDVHEITPRSHFGKHGREELFKLENRCCVCRACHGEIHNDLGRGELFNILSTRHGYKYAGVPKCLLEEYLEESS